jgi:glycosyltransferase involved in cell wall biosynthesis
LPAAELTLVGVPVKDYFEAQLKAAAEVDGLDVHALGPYAPHQLPGLLDGVDVVVVPSVWRETYSIVIREAFACGIPVLASRLGALPEGIREGENGMLFEAGSAFELAHLLRTLDEDRELLTRLRDGIRSTDWISVPARADRMRAILCDVVEHRRPELPPATGFAELTVLRDGLRRHVPAT